MRAVDYSGRPPNPAHVAAAGFGAILRYLSRPVSNPKNLTRAEADAARAAGLDICMVWEQTAQRPLGGAAAGTPDGAEAKQRAAECNAPTSAAVYFAVDFDAQPAQLGVIEMYLRAAALSVAPHPVGVYGSYAVCEAMLRRGAARYAWQTAAWSGGKRLAAAHLYQRIGGVTIDGTPCDINDVLQPDYGGWATPAAPGPTPSNRRPPEMILVHPPNEGIYVMFGVGDLMPLNRSEHAAAISAAGVPSLDLTAEEWAKAKGA